MPEHPGSGDVSCLYLYLPTTHPDYTHPFLCFYRSLSSATQPAAMDLYRRDYLNFLWWTASNKGEVKWLGKDVAYVDPKCALSVLRRLFQACVSVFL